MKREKTIAGKGRSYKTDRTYGSYRTYMTYGVLVLLLWLLGGGAFAQIKIGGNVYGGGNKGNVEGSTKVTVRSGDIGAVLDPDAERPLTSPRGKVFGGARMANVGGNTYVLIDGENASGYITANYVFGGNDIAGNIGTAAAVGEDVPSELDNAATDGVDNTWNSYVHISSKMEGDEISPDNEKIYIGQLFAAGNGEYDYEAPASEGDTYKIKDKKTGTVIAENATGFTLPEVDKTYLDVQGGSIVYAYGGGNNATVREKTVIHVDNPSEVVNEIKVDAAGLEDNISGTNILTWERFREMGINTGFSKPDSKEFQIGRFFGGNNMAEMAIRPTWNLESGLIRNLYSGGNKGAMTSPDGLLLNIPATSTVVVDNVFGGCRMADVMPSVDGEYQVVQSLPGYKFPAELSARLLLEGGDINNVYGGNDITGTVYGGNAIALYTSIRGNLYGGGNGAYPYTDSWNLRDSEIFGDLYYGDRSIDDFTFTDQTESVEALNAYRPDAEQVSILMRGTVDKPVFIHGSVFCGGNCATLDTKKVSPMVELKIGSYVTANQVFLGNNGEGMVTKDVLEHYKYSVIGPLDAVPEGKKEGDLLKSGGTDFSSLDLTDSTEPDIFAKYMDGVVMKLQPQVIFETTPRDLKDYIDNTTKIGSFYCGGNVGSMAIAGKNTYSFDRQLIIFNKIVGGCNNANVPVIKDDDDNPLNAAYEGGILGSADEWSGYVDASGNIKDRLELNLNNVTIEPKRWKEAYTIVPYGTPLTPGKTYYTSAEGTDPFVATSEVSGLEDTYYYELNMSASRDLIWNTVKWDAVGHEFVQTDTGNSEDTSDDEVRRMLGGNVYGGCYNSGHVNGNVVINITQDLIDRESVFAVSSYDEEKDEYSITGERRSGVILDCQRDDLHAISMSVFGGGYGKDTEIWGSTTVNHHNGYCFQIFGGSEMGVIGKYIAKSDAGDGTYDSATGDYTTNGKKYSYNPAYSTTVNLKGLYAGYAEGEGTDPLPEIEYIYGGGNEGDVCGNCVVNLGNGRIYDAFGGACDANILGHTETYIGRSGVDGSGNDVLGFPWIRDIVYGANDFGGRILGKADFQTRLRTGTYSMVYGEESAGTKDVLQASSYVDYLQGRVDQIYGGSYGDYDYADEDFNPTSGRPDINAAFVHLHPLNNSSNKILQVFGGGEGHSGDRIGDKMQDRSYVLVDLDKASQFSMTEVFGAGNNNGIGMGIDKATASAEATADQASAIIDLVSGRIANAYGGSYNEGITRRTVVNVPSESSITLSNIFGGAYGTQILPPCDVYETNVNYGNTSEKASVGAIYGGNNNERRSLRTKVNISSPVWTDKEKGYLASVYGAGLGIDTWAEYTEVNLNSGARVYEAYGGGKYGHVLNAESVQKYMQLYKDTPSDQISKQDPKWKNPDRWSGGDLKAEYLDEWHEDWADAWTFGDYYTPDASYTNYVSNAETNLSQLSNRPELETDANAAAQLGSQKFNANVIINEGATIVNYAYGGGWGDSKTALSGDTYGTTYIALLGGEVYKDIYAGGTAGGVYDLFAAKNFTATANAYVRGGTVRNVYGGGWRGSVGRADYTPSRDPIYSDEKEVIYAQTPNFWDEDGNYTDIPGESHVVIGRAGGSTHVDGIPSVTRNVYGGGEGGGIYGTAKVYVNKGYIGYRYSDSASDDPETPYFDERYIEELDEKTAGDKVLDAAGNVFGGGYVANSYVDHSELKMFGGVVRGSLYGGGEIGPIGRGTLNKDGTLVPKPAKWFIKDDAGAWVYRAGTTHVQLYDGYVKRNVFGGGRGYDNWGGEGYMTDGELATMDRSAKGYVFGKTEVDIYGGEVGTKEGVALGYGNVFGGGDIGFVHSAYELNGKLHVGKKQGTRYDGLDNSEGYYYKYNGEDFVDDNGDELALGAEKHLTEDCKVLIEPWLKANDAVTIDGTSYAAGAFVPTSALNMLGNKTASSAEWGKLGNKTDVNKNGIIIRNGVFAGGNVSPGSSIVYAATTTVFGNATASIHDVYHRDLITVGSGHTGGLYGDGNLTFVDGYRELNITNYGTDYYIFQREISLEEYNALSDREADYYQRRYRCAVECKANNGRTYTKGSTISESELLKLFEGVKVEDRDLTGDFDGDGLPISTPKSPSVEVNMIDLDGNPHKAYWVENGVCTQYAGRIMNTIQRADFCGVWGSRMVMQGAQDRVPATVDYTNYTINRVREVSLNRKKSTIEGDKNTDRSEHGNYFGIYSVVNFLGALTSDVDFHSTRTTTNTDTETYGPEKDGSGEYVGDDLTYYDWKAKWWQYRKRNNGYSPNKVALASGVYLELTSEKGTGDGLYEKDWGYITGVVELDLISVQPGLGGGFVYAKNEHGVRSLTGKTQTILTELNRNTGGTPAITNKKFRYTTDDSTKKEWETSGNFIHSTLTIIDDCYNIGGKYKTEYKAPDGVPAHYWYIKGSVYVYDQYISAYTGSSNAYSETVNIPLTITSASHGKMTLLDVQPNFYAYKNAGGTKLGADEEVVLRDVTYKLNDPITYWDYFMLSDAEKAMFVQKTYVVVDSCQIGGKVYPPGYVMLPGNVDGGDSDTYWAMKKAADENLQQIEKDGPLVPAVTMMTKDENGDPIEERDRNGDVVYKAFTDVFCESNNASHDQGYILTYKVDNPSLWDTWYTEATSAVHAKNQTGGTGYESGPTYTAKTTGLYGQQDYKVGNIISQDVYTTYGTAYGSLLPAQQSALPTQATFEPAYIVTKEILETTSTSGPQRLYKNATLCQSNYDTDTWNDLYDPDNLSASSVAPAYVVTRTIQLSETDYIYRGSYMTETEKDSYINPIKAAMNEIVAGAGNMTAQAISESTTLTDLQKEALMPLATSRDEYDTSIVPAYYCTSDGKYGGDYYEAGHNYRGLAAWSSLPEGDRSNFTFNYDALDLFIDPNYSKTIDLGGHKYQYDGKDFTSELQAETNQAHYSLPTRIDYTAEYNSNTPMSLSSNVIVNRGGTSISTNSIQKDDVLTGEVYESLLNECYYYSPIKVDKLVIGGDGEDKNDPYPYYVVSSTKIIGDIPYAAGQVIDADTYKNLTDSEKSSITTLTFTATGTYYYCREGYTIAASADGGVAVTDLLDYDSTTHTYKSYSPGEDVVPAGVLIDADNYAVLTNKQKDFVIHGLAPTETSTLYVSRNSNIKDLSKEKIITVIYEYDYVETDNSGSIVPVSEYHVLNIHLTFKSGIPTVEDIQPPGLILPGYTVSIMEPFVTPGAYEVTGGGWELFDDPGDAESHINGIEYTPSKDQLYLYQDQYLVAYYAQTYLGKTYSNAVPVSVANYHDLKKVMDAKEHHYYIDHKDLFDREDVIEPKIYINDYSGTGENGLDIFKSLYDLSVLSSPTTDSEGLITGDANFTGHKPLRSDVAAGNNLEFFLRTDIDHSPYERSNPDYDPDSPEDPVTNPKTITENTWTPIGSATETCFEGTVHGDGHHLSGLDHSLFNHLCGDVYNLGVSGSFNGAGIAETGSGYVENCWISTTAPSVNNVYAVFGNPSRTQYMPVKAGTTLSIGGTYYTSSEGDGRFVADKDTPKATGTNYYEEVSLIQMVNSYYPVDNEYKVTTPAPHGIAIQKPQNAFYNGEVAYDLNGFYLYKRYCDQVITSGSEYQNFTIGSDNKVVFDDDKMYYYASNPEYCSSGYLSNIVPMYVEDRFADGDFRYAGGTIPTTENERYRTWKESYTNPDTGREEERDAEGFFPIWPDDYFFFGQKLTYGHLPTQTHQEVPKAINRSDNGRVDYSESGNRVYRAPAYYRSKKMSVAHYNPYAIFAQKSADGTRDAYPQMTAIDFTDARYGAFETYRTYDKGSVDVTTEGSTTSAFYPPLLDDGGLTGFINHDETRNLLVYVPKPDDLAQTKTYTVVTDANTDPVYAETDPTGYRTVAENETDVGFHIVKRTSNDADDYYSDYDHFLVDKQDFNCPIAYDFEADYRMWYQRKPGDHEYVDHDKGWQGISLPFSAELVTTNDKGEITHFYNGSEPSKNSTGTKIGHEYWLREFEKINVDTSADPDVATANFIYPAIAGDGSEKMEKQVTNHFLWDYYYQGIHSHLDQNADTYQTYYNQDHTYSGYPLLTASNPYIIGFPGETYYEFDLSGAFEAKTTGLTKPTKLERQIITFASDKGVGIGVSDDETDGVARLYDVTNYIFKPSYMNEEMKPGTFVLNSDGNAYTRLNADADVNTTNKVTPTQYAFRPYFMESGVGGPKNSKGGVRSIVFSKETAQMFHQEEEEEDDISSIGQLIIKAKKGKIVVTSTLQSPKDVVIISADGATVDRYTIQPGKTVETPIIVSGVYIVNKKKLSVRIKN